MVQMDEAYEGASSDSSEGMQENTLKRTKKDKNKSNKKAKLSEENGEAPKKKTNPLYKKPTAEELNQLRETENLFNSNIFRLQIDELLQEVSVKPRHIMKFDEWLKSFKSFLNTLPELKDHYNKEDTKAQIKSIKTFSKFIKTEYNPSIFDDKLININYMKPKDVQVFASYGNLYGGTIKYSANVFMTIPSNYYEKKEFKSDKYLHKKQKYLLYVMYCLQKSDLVKSVELTNYMGNELMQILKIQPNYSDSVEMLLFAIPEMNTFKATSLLPYQNNIAEPMKTINKCSLNASPNYNSLVLFDATLEENEAFIQKILVEVKYFRDAIKLLIVWLKQRGLNNEFHSFTNHMATYLVIYLLVNKKISRFMSSYQIVRITWTFISKMYDEELLTITKQSDERLKDFKGVWKCVMLDCTGVYNICSFMDDDVLEKVKNEARFALSCLDSNKFNTFANLFTVRMLPELQYEIILRISNEDLDKVYDSASDEEKFKYLGFETTCNYNVIKKYLKYGLNKRIKELIPLYSPSADGSNIYSFGINLDQVHCTSVVEKGPKQYDKGVEEFKKFWGEKAQLRRFKDLSIHEAVFFEDIKTIQDKRLIFTKIIDFILKDKFALNYKLFSSELETMLTLNKVTYPFPCGTNEEATLIIKNLHFEFSEILRNLELPLGMINIQGISDLYSYADLFPPIQTNFLEQDCCVHDGNAARLVDVKEAPQLLQPVECVVELASNGKWPNELPAFRAMKLVFLHETAALLKKQHKLETVIGYDYNDYFDIYFKGIVFRTRVHHPKEIGLVKKTVIDGLECYRDNEESLLLERNLLMLPMVTGALNGLQQENPSFGPSTCLIKRWLRAQLLDQEHISDAVIHLLNAHLYISSEPYQKSTLPQVAFLRFLKFISDFDFEFQPITINFNDSLPAEKISELETNFMKQRENHNSLHIITPFDDGKSIFTKHSPTPFVLNRIKILAKASFEHLSNSITSGESLDFKPLFVPNFKGYNLLIELSDHHNPRAYQHIFKNEDFNIQMQEFDPAKQAIIPIVDFNPVELYLAELRKDYGDIALFFHDYYGGNVIAVLWRKGLLESVEFKVSSTNARRLVGSQLSLNIDALIEDFYLLGKGLVTTIEIL